MWPWAYCSLIFISSMNRFFFKFFRHVIQVSLNSQILKTIDVNYMNYHSYLILLQCIIFSTFKQVTFVFKIIFEVLLIFLDIMGIDFILENMLEKKKLCASIKKILTKNLNHGQLGDGSTIFTACRVLSWPFSDCTDLYEKNALYIYLEKYSLFKA